jgi:SAM-dependent methyltransferase
MNGYFYDVATGLVERRVIAPLRQGLIFPLRREIVDVGAGTGANFRYFHPGTHVVAFEPDPSMARRARSKIAHSGARIELRIADDSGLETRPSERVDAVVMTLVLCTVDDPISTLRRAKRVLKPAGTLILIEHVRSPGTVGRFQDFIAPAWRRIASGCHLDRETVDAVGSVGFDVAGVATKRLPKFFPIQEIIYGRLPLTAKDGA